MKYSNECEAVVATPTSNNYSLDNHENSVSAENSDSSMVTVTPTAVNTSIRHGNLRLLKSGNNMDSTTPTESSAANYEYRTKEDESNCDIEFVDTGMSRQSLSFISFHPGSNGHNVQDFYYSFGWFDKLTGVISIVLFFVDLGTDINLAVTYFKVHKWLWGIETIVVVAVPSLIICSLGLQWYIIDYRKEKQKQRHIGRCFWFFRIFFTVILCGPVIRTIEYLHCGYKSRCKDLGPAERYMYYRYMLRHSVDICLLHLFESFFEAAPQLAMQLYIMIVMKPDSNFLHSSLIALALLTSWSSLAISLTSYNKSLRVSMVQKEKMSLKSVPFYFIWRASEVGGRILCIAMFATVFKYWIFLVLGIHWIVMYLWLIEQKTKFYNNRCWEIAFNFLCGYVMIFCFLNLREGQTRFRFLIYYCVTYIENFIMLAFWFRFTNDLGAWFHLWGFVAVFLLFAVHLIFQLLYYTIFHPTKDIKMCLPCDRYLVYSSMCSDVSPEARNKSKILYSFRTDGEETVSQGANSTAV